MSANSILSDTKKVLGIHESNTDFDLDVMMHINTSFNTLLDLGVGPAEGFMITDKAAVWSDFTGEDLNLNSVKTYVCLSVRMVFDPPTTSHAITALQEQLKALEWRINMRREGTSWTAPV